MDTYRKLANHLNSLPGSFEPSSSGADIRLLQKLFTPAEAELAIHLTLQREDSAVIAARAGLEPALAAHMLHEMARKGLIFSIEPEGGTALYQAAAWVVGIWEFQVKNLDPELLALAEDYFAHHENNLPVEVTRQVRYIPINESIQTNREALTYERVHEILKDEDRFAVAPCICRTMAKMHATVCSAPVETCLMFGDWADYYVRNGLARRLERDGVMEKLAEADKANLVLQVTNSKEISFICCCCGCCCGPLSELKAHPTPSKMVVSPFRAHFEADLCIGCETCLTRCQMEAFTPADGSVVFNAQRCIGCGLCVSTCPSGALELRRLPEAELPNIPADIDDMMREMQARRDKLNLN
jgi:Na+-translocating ferredoxin:NAD+ oxidoreductase subunit B